MSMEARSGFGPKDIGAATLVLFGLALAWAGLALVLYGVQPRSTLILGAQALCLVSSASGAALASVASVRWVGILAFGLGGGVSILVLLLIQQT